MNSVRQLDIPTDVPTELIVGFARCRQLETWLREMVYLETKAHYGLAYWNECEAALTRHGGRSIPSSRSLARDQRHPHMSTAENDPLWFTSFDALLKILFDDLLWPLFEPYLTTKKILEAKFEEISMIRNRVAHGRGLHQHDLDRLLLILRELDQGFFRFCASYGDDYLFHAEERGDPVYQHFVGQHPWHDSDLTTNLDLKYVLRPNTAYEEAWTTRKGRLYHYVVYRPARYGQHFDYSEIFRLTRSHHDNVAHLIMDSDQRFLHVIIPSILPVDIITATAERFYQVCANSHGRLLKNMLQPPAGGEREGPVIDPEKWEAIDRIFEALALEWPHYVIPPSHAYAILDSTCTPCSMFGA
jgi:hypothetical protein